MIDVVERYTEYVKIFDDVYKPGSNDRACGVIESLLSERIGQLSPGDIMIEVGVASFYTGGFIAFCYPWLKVIGIDNFSEGGVEQNRRIIDFQMGCFPNLVFIEGESVAMAAQVDDKSIGLCFIDANHTYDSVLADIAAWRGKIKPGGWMAFHDAQWSTVRKAIEDSRLVPEFIFDCREDVPNGFEIWQKESYHYDRT